MGAPNAAAETFAHVGLHIAEVKSLLISRSARATGVQSFEVDGGT